MQKRAGTTEKISVSIEREDLKALKRRAKRLYGGNVSAVIAELASDAKLLEGMQELVDTLGGPSLTDEDRRTLDRDWKGESKRGRRAPKSKSAA